MRSFTILLLLIGINLIQAAAQPRVVAECSITYTIAADDAGLDKDAAESFKSSTKTVYIKGNDSRTDLISPSFSQSLLYNKTNGTAVILREFGNNKFMTKLDNAKLMNENKRYDGLEITLLNDTKTILRYECKKAIIQLKDGSQFAVFYTTSIVPSVREFEYQFKDIPGLVLEYEAQEGEKRIKYTANKVTLDPVQASKFDIPTSGYRILNQ